MMKIKFTTISPVVLSPRMEKALYKDVDFKKIADINMINLARKERENIKIVYPFYSYDSRDLLPENEFLYAKEYYIPASSLKGALLGMKRDEKENILRSGILFRDIELGKSDIKLKNLYKFQYLYQDNKEENGNNGQGRVYKTPKFGPFFPSVAVEMIESGKEFEGEILLRPEVSEEVLKNRLNKNFLVTKNKLENYIKEVEGRIQNINFWIKNKKINKQEEENEDCIEKLENIQKRMQQIKSRKNIIFLGGYKGILGSLSRLDKNRNIQNGFYIDEETMLPYGLVELSITGQSKF
ncbi:MAG: hypothetical protein ACTTKU_04700 [Eggerthia catenaformis]|uniref:hypothetical protein n=1 Tax=Eggerthia catenaformis TaxID=31973 RepID=UPI000A7E4F71